MTEYGSDVSTVNDLDISGVNISGKRAIAENIVRRLTTTAGRLEYADGLDSLDLAEYLSAQINDRDLFSLSSKIESICEQDERVESADADLVVEGEGLRITLLLVPFELPSFTLVISADAVTLEILTLG